MEVSHSSPEEVAFWVRVAGKIIEVLSSYTREGSIFSVDTRLRPGGQEGELVVTEDSLLQYLGESAHVWEALTYLKASPVAGNLALARRITEALGAAVIKRFSSYPDLGEELLQMRERFFQHLSIAGILGGCNLVHESLPGEKQGFFLAQCLGLLGSNDFLDGGFPVRLGRFHLRLDRLAFPSSGHRLD